MPLYDYQCESCGTFSALKRMSEASQPCLCDNCGELAPRIISAPNLALVSSATRSAHERNEKSAHEPAHIRRSSCGCSGSHTCSTSSKNTQGKQAEKKSNGLAMQTKKTARPWMLGH